jgi:hypothetical protein
VNVPQSVGPNENYVHQSIVSQAETQSGLTCSPLPSPQKSHFLTD